MNHTSHIFTGSPESSHGVFTTHKVYNRVAGFERGNVSKGFYIDNNSNFKLVSDQLFEIIETTLELNHPEIIQISRPDRMVLAERWGVNEITINNWQRPGELCQPWRLNDALKNINEKPNTIVLKPGELAEIASSNGHYISELSVRWGWHYGGETLNTIVADPNRVSLFWDMLAGLNK
jgi:hypothetical protein